LDVFLLRDTVAGEYKKFATLFTTIFAEGVRGQIDAIYGQDRYWLEPLIQIDRATSGRPQSTRLRATAFVSEVADLLRSPPGRNGSPGKTLSLYKHQERAIAPPSQGEIFVVTTGTGSGKTLCFRFHCATGIRHTVEV
jgi:ATP-dependent helicase YprA (DUF1998 family)